MATLKTRGGQRSRTFFGNQGGRMVRNSTAKNISTREAMEIKEQESTVERRNGDQISAAEPMDRLIDDSVTAARIVREERSRNARKAAFKRWGVEL
jgi:hypothetical protein